MKDKKKKLNDRNMPKDTEVNLKGLPLSNYGNLSIELNDYGNGLLLEKKMSP